MEETLFGNFFSPSKENSPIEAQLQISKDGSSLLIANDVFSDGDNIYEECLLGEDAKGQYYSILNALYKLKTTTAFSGNKKSEVVPGLLLVGKRIRPSRKVFLVKTISEAVPMQQTPDLHFR